MKKLNLKKSSPLIKFKKEEFQKVLEYTRLLKKIYLTKDVLAIREASYQLIFWLSKASNIESPKFRIRSYPYKKQQVMKSTSGAYEILDWGQYNPNNNLIMVFLHTHWNHDDNWLSYLDTLVHEWIHHWEEIRYNKKTYHDKMFDKRLSYVLKQLKKRD